MNNLNAEDTNYNNWMLLLNQKTRICAHTKEIVELDMLDNKPRALVIKCAKCRACWSLDGYSHNEA